MVVVVGEGEGSKARARGKELRGWGRCGSSSRVANVDGWQPTSLLESLKILGPDRGLPLLRTPSRASSSTL